MAPVVDASNTDTSTVDASTTKGETVESTSETQSSEATVSWGPVKPTRFRSVAIGVTLAVVGIAGWQAVSAAPAVASRVTVTATGPLLVFGVLLLVGGPFSLVYWAVAYDESTDTERQSLKNTLLQDRPDLSEIRPIWVGVGAVVTGSSIWLLDGSGLSIHLLPSILGLAVPLFFQEWRTSYTFDPTAGVVEIDSGSRTKQKTLEWAVDVRRVSLGSQTLFVFSNRGKRWYEGLHLLRVPTELASNVDSLLQQVVDRQDPPPRIRRDERIIIGAIGVSMLGVGPLLYLLSNEPAMLLIGVGPSALVAHGLLLHVARA